MKRRLFLQGAGALAFVPTAAAAAPAVDPAVTGRLASRLKGRLVLPGEAAYDRLRRLQSAKYDRRPAMILRCADEEDVRRGVEFAARQGLPLGVKSGGHGLAGRAMAEGGLVLDMGDLNAVGVDAARRTARVGGGVLAGAIDRASAPHGLATVLGECPTVGYGGFALGGGEGFLMGRFGVGCDNVRAVRLVLADGRPVTASARSHPDLFWAVRGGGGAFGVVTGFELDLHPVTEVLAGRLRFKGERLADALAAWRDFCAQAPDELTGIFHIYPDADGRASCSVRLLWSGEIAAGERALQPLRRHPAVVADNLRPMAYAAFQAQGPADPEPSFDLTRSGFLPAMDAAAIDALAAAAQAQGVDYSVSLAHLHGAVCREGEAAGAYPLRTPGFDCWLTAAWSARSGREAAEAWVTAAWARIGPLTRGAYVNGLDDEGPERVRAAYGDRYGRLQRIKRAYDSDGLFRPDQPITAI